MEVNEGAKIAIARPVASRPRCLIYKSFSELLAGAIDISSTDVHSEMAITAIRPKTVRLKPTTNNALVGDLSSQVGMSGAPVGSPSDNILQLLEKPKVLYKPMAKLAPRKTIPLLENKGTSASDQQREVADREAHVHSENEVKQQHDLTTESQQSRLEKSGQDKKIVHSTIVSENTEEVEQSLINTSNVDRPSYDGYNWRKYGQKQVKGSEYPRSYYKCTHLKCPVKKKVERSFDGQIAEIVYRGEHNHPKPQPPKRNLSDGQGRAAVCNDNTKETNKPAWSNQHPHTSEAYVCRMENQNDVGLSIHSAYSSKAPCFYDSIAAAGMHTAALNSEDSAEGSKKLEATCDEPKSKRRKIEGQPNEAGTSGESAFPYMPNQNTTDSEITGDGFRWRKYGQKVVKGSSYPRSYYRCTSPKCNVRKFVERTTDDPKAFINTYEGKHNHGVPNRRPNSESSKTSSKSSAMKDKS
ncbi:PREDICTED: WRKY transcription factor 44 [Nicotiana attenuata]|uniref:Wrky transcription factor 44 n=1 Tax=Nicotiana attenuata TaxID=49451 RepID=A0A1J6K936_NICAT|nr:PREDICTED: WRKY transcription factor 44 [Nicotiana attenuata]XP_019235460.1 PREDICTED: WRKY transcription factor 44 [Nicotiana attenuata]XP_019235461.1 PREDICTED: WRKY transcription factor 44 [Nicotiana attenuata]XP_019235462.1 PREDICTED: WRKY transcription factor 44 [Nicotiana attenuata]OIT25862.1 wrky transcription factor 44 [Nicotiana attenuata]